jgi:hypothetical protein
MATTSSSFQLQSTGEISLTDIYEILYGTTVTNPRSLRSMSSLANFTVPDPINEFYDYIVYITSDIDAWTFPANFPGIQKIANVTIEGGDETFTSSDNRTWITTLDHIAGGTVTINVGQNAGALRTGTVTIQHDNNVACFVTIAITQSAGLTTTTTTTTTTNPPRTLPPTQ